MFLKLGQGNLLEGRQEAVGQNTAKDGSALLVAPEKEGPERKESITTRRRDVIVETLENVLALERARHLTKLFLPLELASISAKAKE